MTTARGPFPQTRMRRLRAQPFSRALVSENTLAAQDLIYPVFVLEGEVFGKPADAKEAIDRWQRMAGGSGELLTGHCLVANGQGATMACVSTVVQFAALRLGEIEAYVASGEPLNCAGGFALEGRGGLLIRGLNGCYSNVIGLSLPWLRTALEAHCAG